MELIQAFCQVEIWPEELPPPQEVLLVRVRGMQGLLSLLTDRIDASVMDAAGPCLQVISNHAVGVDNVDLAAATERGIPVGNTPGILTDATADMTFALLLAAGRRLIEANQVVRTGGWKTWSPGGLLGADLAGTTLGIVGFGRIGRAVAHRAAGFRMRLIYSEPQPCADEPGIDASQVDFDTLLRESDFISIHCPLTQETRGLFNGPAFQRMKHQAVLVNTARGPIVDAAALLEALRSRRIFAAGLDVTDPEPLPAYSPLLELDNLVVVPHIASASWKSRENMSRMAAENLIAGLKGERLPYCANPEVYTDRAIPAG
jgi:lactate dehydrogenase-like 2-hydroxyacid dehydrogenase